MDEQQQQLQPPPCFSSAGATVTVANGGGGGNAVSFIAVTADDSSALVGTWDGEFLIVSLPEMLVIHKQRGVGGPVMLMETLVGSTLCAVVVAPELPSSGEGEHLPAVSVPAGSAPSSAPAGLVGGGDATAACREVQLWDYGRGERLGRVHFPFLSSSAATGVADGVRGAADTTAECDGSSPPATGHSPLPAVRSCPIVAVKLSRRRLVVFMDCPANEIWVLDLKSLRVLRTLERRTVKAARPPRHLPAGFSLGQAWNVRFHGSRAYYGACPSLSLASVAAISLHPCVGLLAVPVCVPAVQQGTERLTADATLVAATAAEGAFDPAAQGLGTLVLLEIHTGVALARSARVAAMPLAALAMNAACTLLVTVSVKGTVVRAWALPSLAQISCWRRGARPARVLSLKLTWDSAFVVALTAAHSPRDPLERSLTAHLFSFARHLTPQARQLHLPPLLGPPPLSATVQSNDKQAGDAGGGDCQVDKEWACVSREDLLASSPLGLSGPENEGRAGRSCNNRGNATLQKLHEIVATAKGTLRQKLQELASCERVEMLLLNKDSSIAAPKAFAVAHVKLPWSLAAMNPSMIMAGASVREEGGTVELLVLSGSGCMLMFTGDRRRGGELKIRSETFFNRF